MTMGGVLLPDSAKEKPIAGEVVAVGPGKREEDGTRKTPSVSFCNNAQCHKLREGKVEMALLGIFASEGNLMLFLPSRMQCRLLQVCTLVQA